MLALKITGKIFDAKRATKWLAERHGDASIKVAIDAHIRDVLYKTTQGGKL